MALAFPSSHLLLYSLMICFFVIVALVLILSLLPCSSSLLFCFHSSSFLPALCLHSCIACSIFSQSLSSFFFLSSSIAPLSHLISFPSCCIWGLCPNCCCETLLIVRCVSLASLHCFNHLSIDLISC